MASDNSNGTDRKNVPLQVPTVKPEEQYSLEMTPEDLDRQSDPREAQQVNRVILSGQGTAQNDRTTGGKAAPGGIPNPSVHHSPAHTPGPGGRG